MIYNKENLRIGTRIVLVFSIFDEPSGEILATSNHELIIQELFKELTGERYTRKFGMELHYDRN